MRSESYDELAFMVERLTWDVLDDELDESDPDDDRRSAQRAAQPGRARDRPRPARSVARPAVLGKAPSADMQAELGQQVTWLGGVGQATLATRLLDRRVALLDSIARTALRGHATHLREFRFLLETLADRLPGQAGSLRSFAWDAVYDNSISARLEQVSCNCCSRCSRTWSIRACRSHDDGRCSTMNRRGAEFRAVQDFVVALSTVSQRTDMTAIHERPPALPGQLHHRTADAWACSACSRRSSARSPTRSPSSVPPSGSRPRG